MLPCRACCPPVAPRYADLWTGAKGFYKVEPIVADGGEVILYAPHITQIASTHPGLDTMGYHCRDLFLAHWDEVRDLPRGELAHSTHLFGAGTYDPVEGERQRVRVTLATGIPEEVVRGRTSGTSTPPPSTSTPSRPTPTRSSCPTPARSSTASADRRPRQGDVRSLARVDDADLGADVVEDAGDGDGLVQGHDRALGQPLGQAPVDLVDLEAQAFALVAGVDVLGLGRSGDVERFGTVHERRELDPSIRARDPSGAGHRRPAARPSPPPSPRPNGAARRHLFVDAGRADEPVGDDTVREAEHERAQLHRIDAEVEQRTAALVEVEEAVIGTTGVR